MAAHAEQELIPEDLMSRVADRLKLLGQPVRLRLIELLMNGPGTPQALSDALGLSQQNVSKHLLSLHRAGIVSRQRDGINVIYALVDDAVATIMNLTVESVNAELRALSRLALGAEPQSVVAK